MGTVGNFVRDVKLAKNENDAKREMLDRVSVDSLRAIAKRRKIKLVYYDYDTEKWVAYKKKASIVRKLAKSLSFDDVFAICESKLIPTADIRAGMVRKAKKLSEVKPKPKTTRAPLKTSVKAGIDKAKAKTKAAKKAVSARARKSLVDMFV